MLLMIDDDDKKLFILKAEVSRRPLCSVMGRSILAPEHIVHRTQATNPKSHSHNFSVSEIRDFEVILRLIRILQLKKATTPGMNLCYMGQNYMNI